MIDGIRRASESFWDSLSDIAILALLAAIGCHLLKLGCTSRAWRNVLAAAYPERTVRWPQILAAYVSGVGVNAVVPARAGDVVRVVFAHRAIPSSTYTTIVSSTAVLSFVDMSIALLIFGWALTQAVLPRSTSSPNAARPSTTRGSSTTASSRSPSGWRFASIVVGGCRGSCTTSGTASASRASRRLSASSTLFTRYVRTVVVWQLA